MLQNAHKSREMVTQHMYNSCDGVCGAVRGAEKAACHFPLHSSLHYVTIWGKDSSQRVWNRLWVIRASQLSIFLTYFPLLLPAICSPLTPPPLPHILIYISSPDSLSHHFYNCLTVLHLSFLVFFDWCRLISSVFMPHVFPKFFCSWLHPTCSFLSLPPSSCWKHPDFFFFAFFFKKRGESVGVQKCDVWNVCVYEILCIC